MTGPLAGIKVIEIAQAVAGPMAGMILGDMGAEVIRSKSPMAATTPAPGDRLHRRRLHAVSLDEPQQEVGHPRHQESRRCRQAENAGRRRRHPDPEPRSGVVADSASGPR